MPPKKKTKVGREPEPRRRIRCPAKDSAFAALRAAAAAAVPIEGEEKVQNGATPEGLQEENPNPSLNT